MIDPQIHAIDLRVTYNEGKPNEYQALRGETVEVYPQEYIILFGPSGCGKSTLLYSMLGILAPSGGKMMIKGEDIYAYSTQEMVKFQQSIIGIIYQSFNLIPSLSVLDNVALPRIFANVPPAERYDTAHKLLKRFGVDHQAHKLPQTLSGGQQQRIAVARSLVNDPEILLADEPVGNLDSISSDQVMNTLGEINQGDRKSIILVTHDAKFLPYAHRVYFLKDGQVEREVVNPEKVPIKPVRQGATILTEVEKLARVYPYATPEELRVKSIVNYLTEDLSFDQLERIEKMVQGLIQGRISDDTLVEGLATDFNNGGVGLEATRAEIMRQKVRNILKEAEEIRRYRKRLEQKVVSSKQKDRIAQVRDHLLSEYETKLNPMQLRYLDDALMARVAGISTMEEFRDRLQAKVEGKGVELSVEEARNISRYLEKLVAQGVHL